MEKRWSVYILRCGDGTLYTGITDDVQARFQAHSAGKGAKYTRGRGPLELIYQRECENHSAAAKLEWKIKQLPRREKLELIERHQHDGGKFMTFDEVRKAAQGRMGACKACPVCNGLACGKTIPGPGSKGSGTVFARNYQAWQDVLLNLDTIAENVTPDTRFNLFGHEFKLPVFAAPIGGMQNQYGDALTEYEYVLPLVKGCLDSGIAAFTGDGVPEFEMGAACEAMEKYGFAVPTIKPWNKEVVFRKIDQAKAAGAKVLCMDIDASGLPFLKNTVPPSGSKTVSELKEFIDYAGIPFIIKGIMTPRGAEKAIEAGAAGIVVSNHGGRVLDGTPSTAEVLPEIVKAVKGEMTILVDGGIRSGLDVFKAIALGADGVVIARPFVTAVYGGGSEGIEAYVAKLKAELSDVMSMCGAKTIADIDSSMLYNC
jgi:predicted GIY-YIG superfamily endonuclease